MTETATFRGQRWTLDEAGHRLVFETAFAWTGLSQERVRLDSKVVFESLELRVYWQWTDVVAIDWPPTGERIIVQSRSGMIRNHARFLADRKRRPHTDYQIARWQSAHGVWPD